MRSTLIFGLLAVLLIGLIRFETDLIPGSGDSVHTPLEALDVTVFSCGPGLMPVPWFEEPMADAIVVGDHVYTEDGVPGLRLVISTPAGNSEVATTFSFDKDPDADLERLHWVFSEVTIERLAILSSIGSWLEGDAERRKEVEALLVSVGASTPPFGKSWSLITARTGKGWFPLAERVSNLRGTRSNYRWIPGVTPPDLGSHLIDTSLEIVKLLSLKPRAYTPGIRLDKNASVGGRKRRGLVMEVPADRVPSGDGLVRTWVEWTGVSIGENPRMRCELFVDRLPDGSSQRALFKLLVNGEEHNRKVLTSSVPERWFEWNIDLSRFENQAIALRIEASFREERVDERLIMLGAPSIGFESRGPVHEEDTSASIAFLGHAYGINGYDKSNYHEYLGFPKAEPKADSTVSVAKRLAVERDPVRMQQFYGGLTQLRADRTVWGGDCTYSSTGAAQKSFLKLVQSVGPGQVWVPGNHDFGLIGNTAAADVFVARAGEDEVLAGMRVLYLDSTTWKGQPNNAARAQSTPSERWLELLDARLERARDGLAGNERGLLLFLHHAPWITDAGTANVGHGEEREAETWWRVRVHPVLADLAGAGGEIWAFGGDAGDYCLAAGELRDGVHYVVTGQPRFDTPVPNGFVHLHWDTQGGQPLLDLHTWQPEEGFKIQREVSFPFRR